MMISVEEYRARVLDHIVELVAYDQPLLDAVGLPAATQLRSQVAVPLADCAAVDGYAVYYSDLVGASAQTPVRLRVVGELAAGMVQVYAMSPGTAVRIMAGAPLPTGANAVVSLAGSDGGLAEVEFYEAPWEGQNIRRRGEELQVDDQLIDDGELITTRVAGLLASAGLARILARPRPRVVVVSTGSELSEPGRQRRRDHIFDANTHLLAASVAAAGAIPYPVGVVTDDPRQFAETLSDQLVRADVVITSGGIASEHDVVREVLAPLGSVKFWQVAMEPGSQQGFGVVGDDRIPIFALPGTPVAAYVSLQLFVLPALRKMMGLLPWMPPLQELMLARTVRSVEGKREFLSGWVDPTGRRNEVVPSDGSAAYSLAGLARANALIVLDEAADVVSAGTMVSVLRLDEHA